jgi:HEPN domain-containing protein
LLEELRIAVAKTHDLDKLLTILQPHHSTLQSLKRGLLFMTDFAVDTRYPDNSTTKRQAIAALRWADKMRTAARLLLGLPLRPRRRTR